MLEAGINGKQEMEKTAWMSAFGQKKREDPANLPGKQMVHVVEDSRELAHAGGITDFFDMHVTLPDGQKQVWDLVHHRQGAACVLPVLNDGTIVMVRQYRPALGRWTLEVPAGCRDSLTEDTAVTAARELEEETGYHCDKIVPLLNLRSTVAFCDEMIDVYLATELTCVGVQHLDEAEAIEIQIWTLPDLLRRVYSGQIQDAKTVAAICAYATYKMAQSSRQ